MKPPKVNAGRLWECLMAMAEVGATPKGGCNRQTLTDEDRRGRDLFRGWCEKAGLQVTVDRLGSMFARREGRNREAPALLIGSHLDTQPTGGKFDGPLGVLGALEVVRTLNDRGIETDVPIEVVNWTNEEGCRFAPAMMASGVFAEAIALEQALEARDRDGKRFGEELERIGYRGEAPIGGGRPVRAYLELHIEQGPVLEAEKKVIGVVTGGQGVRWLDVSINGFEAHAGTTPMAVRRDALVAAAELVQLVRRIGIKGRERRATVGELRIRPQARNVIPGEAWMSVDLRHPDERELTAMRRELKAAVASFNARHRGTKINLADFWHSKVTRFDRRMVAHVRQAAEALGLPHRDMVSGAGHDAIHLSRLAPTAMIFVPCRRGISHNESEFASNAHCAAGASVLLNAALRAAGTTLGGNFRNR